MVDAFLVCVRLVVCLVVDFVADLAVVAARKYKKGVCDICRPFLKIAWIKYNNKLRKCKVSQINVFNRHLEICPLHLPTNKKTKLICNINYLYFIFGLCEMQMTYCSW